MLKPGEAMARFGLVGTSLTELTRSDVMTAYRQMVRTVHPDTAGVPHVNVSMAELQQARDVLLNVVSKRDSACNACGGTGRVKGQVGLRRCTACAGTGDR